MSAASTALLSPLQAALVLLGAWSLVGLAGLALPERSRALRRLPYLAGAAVGAALALAAATGLLWPTQTARLPLGLPGLPLHARLDALSAAFLFLLGAVSVGVSLFAAGYFGQERDGTSARATCLQYHLFLASMGFVILADDAYGFMLAWESMALSSYFLVVRDAQLQGRRRAGLTYLAIAHVGAIVIVFSFALLQAGAGSLDFEALRSATRAPAAAALAFLLALLGFGAKAGLVPLHVWLPEAHPAAPSPVSALMSGVMLKTAVYAMLRVAFDLAAPQGWWWGLVPLALGLFTALYGVVFAGAQRDAKVLLAYSSIENLGILFAGIGVALLFQAAGLRSFAALALLAVLYHALNHAFIKSLLFAGTGAVQHATGHVDLDRLGGLLQRLPWIGWTVLIGALALAGLPPLNGFVSEWLLLQAFLFTPQVPHAFVNMLLPLGAALLVLAVALAAYVMVKFFGLAFLGRPREAQRSALHDADGWQRAGLIWLAAGCVLLGVLPAEVVPRLQAVTSQLHLGAPASGGTWWSLVPEATRQASYSPLLFLAAIAFAVLATFLAVRLFYHGRVRRSGVWTCGFGALDPRAQESAEGFGQPLRRIFEPFFAIERELPEATDPAPRYRLSVADRCWRLLYLPLGRWVRGASDVAAVVQRGRISVYLLYSFLTLLLLLALVL